MSSIFIQSVATTHTHTHTHRNALASKFAFNCENAHQLHMEETQQALNYVRHFPDERIFNVQITATSSKCVFRFSLLSSTQHEHKK